VSIADDRAALAAELEPLLGANDKAVEHALVRTHERSAPDKRNLVSTLASAAWLVALLRSMSLADRKRSLSSAGASDRTRRERALANELDRVAVEVAEELAGPYDVAWDGNWPEAVALRSLSGRIPLPASIGDIIIGSDGGGTRIDIRSFEATMAPSPASPCSPRPGVTRPSKMSGLRRIAASPSSTRTKSRQRCAAELSGQPTHLAALSIAEQSAIPRRPSA
jgi:hypothetical protein